MKAVADISEQQLSSSTVNSIKQESQLCKNSQLGSIFRYDNPNKEGSFEKLHKTWGCWVEMERETTTGKKTQPSRTKCHKRGKITIKKF